MPKRPRKPRRAAADRQPFELRPFTDEDWDRLGWRAATADDLVACTDADLVPWEEPADDDGSKA